jgi:hypothetical protein
MTQQIISVGSAANDGTGDPLRTAFQKINANLTENYASVAALASGIGTAGQVPYSDGAGALAVSANLAYDTSARMLTAGGALGLGAAGSAADAILVREAANIMALRNGVNGQTLRAYNTYTDASNYERGFFRWASNVLEIGAEAAGTGTARALKLYGTSVSSALGVDSWSITNTGVYQTTINALYDLALNSTSGAVQVMSTGTATGPAYMLLRRTGIIFGRDVVSPSIIQTIQAADVATTGFSLTGQAALPSASTTLTGGAGASSSAGNAHGGNLILRGGTKYGTGHTGFVVMDNLPTSAAGLSTGALWNNAGVLNIA